MKTANLQYPSISAGLTCTFPSVMTGIISNDSEKRSEDGARTITSPVEDVLIVNGEVVVVTKSGTRYTLKADRDYIIREFTGTVKTLNDQLTDLNKYLTHYKLLRKSLAFSSTAFKKLRKTADAKQDAQTLQVCIFALGENAKRIENTMIIEKTNRNHRYSKMRLRKKLMDAIEVLVSLESSK